ncbi:hypothetical protein LSUE1_G005961 [Lachnellula suecica]|uniref:Uncharacterized protein n=1 Tax=Lachnellula suecica TaxID=602035 RepID=A0A8T9C6A0_9HELO|nr:hypothetical protein LSUE1_G005961 [Lachnellula suecica]
MRTVLDTDHQLRIANTSLLFLALSDIGMAAQFLTSPLLVYSLAEGVASLPPDPEQWVLEMKNMFTLGLSNLQRNLMGFVTGPPQQYTQYVTPNQADRDPALKWLCRNQIIQRADYANFSTLAIVLIFALGTLITLLSVGLEPLVGRFRRRWSGAGVKVWQLEERDRVPVTEEGIVFGMLGDWDNSSSTFEVKEVPECKQDDSSSGFPDKDGVTLQLNSPNSWSTDGRNEIEISRSNSI